jgi:SAM-dependent methyltransferase
MSSPIANSAPTILQRWLVGFHQRSAHTHRIAKLSAAIGTCINEIFSGAEGPIRALDVGCGDMTMAETLAKNNPRICWTCTDIHELPPHLRSTDKWKNYHRFDGEHLPFEEGTFDVVLFSDVLHHCYPNSLQLLREARRTARYILVKDHFETGLISRQILRLLDFIGNYGYGVLVPKRYFDAEGFEALTRAAGLRRIHLYHGLKIYPFPLSLLLRPSLQFIAVLERSPDENI